jgi:transcriptional regulator with XRE-family HTH domain
MFHLYLLIDPRTGLVRYVGQSRRDPWSNYYSRYGTGCRHNNWLNNVIKKLDTLGLELEFKIESWHQDADTANKKEQELISYYREKSQGKLTNILDGGRKGWTSNDDWMRRHSEGMRNVSKYITCRSDLEKLADLFLKHDNKQSVLSSIGCTEQYLNQLLRGEVHSDLWEEIPTLLDQVLAHADEHGISLGGKGGGSGTPREDRPDDLIYKAFRMYQRGISGHKIQDILNIGVNIYDVLRGKSRPNLLKRWISEGNIPPDLSREYDYQIPDKLLLMALDLKKKGWKHEAIASYVGCSIAFISCVIRGKSRPDIKKKWEIKNGILPKNNMQKRLDDAIGFAIFDLKYNKNISETKIAKQLDVSRQYAHKILKGLNKPHIKQQWESQNKKPE